MKLVRYGNSGAERPGLIDHDGILRDLSAVIRDISGPTLQPESLRMLRSLDVTHLPPVTGEPRSAPALALWASSSASD